MNLPAFLLVIPTSLLPAYHPLFSIGKLPALDAMFPNVLLPARYPQRTEMLSEKSPPPDPIDDKLGRLCSEIQRVQRDRVFVNQSAIKIYNNMLALVARNLGYHSGMDEAGRDAFYRQAEKVVKDIKDGKKVAHPAADLVATILVASEAFDKKKAEYDRVLSSMAKGLPAAHWVGEHDSNQRGFGLLSLGIVAGEAGDLRLYAGPYKLYRRLACAPWTFDGRTLMGSTWKGGKEGRLPASEWEDYGYSPRRRSVAFLIGQNLKMQNKGPYRAKYDEAKAKAAVNHPEWIACSCDGTGRTARDTKCPGCLGKGRKMLRCDRHGMLLATKLLLKRLWNVWNGRREDSNFFRTLARNGYDEQKAVEECRRHASRNGQAVV
jgi:hypothetical protein